MKKKNKKPASPSAKPSDDIIITTNRKARFQYSVVSTLEAGLVLQGSEVKSLRQGQCQLKDSYVVFRKQEAFLQKAHISMYKPAAQRNHHPERRRKLLLKAHELRRLAGQLNQKGFSCVPLKMYFKRGKAKVELAVVKGKKKGDKRLALKQKEMARSAERAIKRHRS